MSSGFFLPAICCGRLDSNAIAITFDDGPIPEKTEKLLSILDKYQIEACFFCVGERVKKNPKIIMDIHEAGHIVGNHSYQHKWNFDLLSARKMEDEINQTNSAIKLTIDKTPRFFRPPYGVTNPNLAKALYSGHHKAIGWSIRSFDTTIKDSEKLMARVTRNIKGGDVILFHDQSDSMLKILPDFINYVRAKGLNIIRLDKLVREDPYQIVK